MTPKIRTAKQSDYNFILSTWLRSFYDLMTGFKPPKNIFFKSHEALIKRHLDYDFVQVVCSEEDDDQILSYIVFTPETLHYIYTKNVFRNFGLAKRLLANKKFNFYTHHTSYIKHLKLDACYNPYLFGEKK